MTMQSIVEFPLLIHGIRINELFSFIWLMCLVFWVFISVQIEMR